MDLYINAYTIDSSTVLVYYIENVSEYDIFLLEGKSEMLPKVYAQFANDSIWYNVSESFYLTTSALPDRSQASNYVGWEKFKIEPKASFNETYDFYYLVIKKIEESNLSMKEYLLEDINDIMNYSLFLGRNEAFSDTILFNKYRIKYPDVNLKFEIAYPRNKMFEMDISHPEYFVNHILKDSLSINLPDKLDGYKVVYDIKLAYDTIIEK